MFEVFTDELYALLDVDEFVKSEIESKAIVVIDEIDKLVRSVSPHTFLTVKGDTTSSTKASDEGV